jgi:hypothetical protein
MSGDRPEHFELTRSDAERIAHALLDSEQLGTEALLVVALKVRALCEKVA